MEKVDKCDKHGWYYVYRGCLMCDFSIKATKATGKDQMFMYAVLKQFDLNLNDGKTSEEE